MPARRLFTSESVTEGHPDKICDAISDAVLDALIALDPTARVAVETMVTTGQVHVAGEVGTDAQVDITAIVRDKLIEIGYDSSLKGFDGATCGVNIAIGAQSPDIAQGVDHAYEARVDGAGDPVDRQGAGDQGLMFGYATSDTPELMPLPIALAHRLSRRLARVRKDGTLPYLRPDGKTQVTIEYDGDRPVRLDTVVISTQHAPDIDLEALLATDVREFVVDAVLAELPEGSLDTGDFRLLVNPTGKFVVGGPMGDAGLTGRKIIVDTYGGMARHGGGAFSGKDPSKVDRSAAYAMRWVAKNAVAAGLAERLEVQVAYAIGRAAPVGLFVETFGTETTDPARIQAAIGKVFDLRPAAIIRDLDLLRPLYAGTAAYGHFGRTDLDLPWERCDRVDELKAAVA
ncbi:methionine adenosyltransferase [Nocardia cyriacigeorgica]|uniref:methionine adenosyltransferase n=1 Tax=Nocardia cyriacigeorgica TaxID=135487 RepID=UPI00245377CA|nr:methionine adenosyltransferase [Nocardia cyriacigeorgica]